MKNFNVLFKAVAVLVAVTAFVGSAAAQELPSKWYFGKKYHKSVSKSWRAEGVAAATDYGQALLKAVKADGSQPDSCIFFRYRPMAGPMQAGDCLVMEFPQTNLPAGSFVEFDLTFAAEEGAPSEWIFEYLDGGRWISGNVYKVYGSPFEKYHQYTSVLETVRLENEADGTLKIRMRALDSNPVTPLCDAAPRAKGYVVIQTHAYLGAYAQNLGVQQPKDTTRVLCLGNSFTYYCSCPALLKEIAWNEGHYLDLAAALKGGQNFGQHCSLNVSADAIAKGGYDLAVMQDQSQTPARLARDRKANRESLDDAVALAEKIRAESPGCKIIVESTWSYVGKEGEYGGFGNHKTFEKLSLKGSRIMAKAIGDAKVSHIAEAYALVRKERPDINLFAADNKHQDILGSYLKSCVNYLTIFGEPFGDKPADCGIDHGVAEYLRTVAERVVL